MSESYQVRDLLNNTYFHNTFHELYGYKQDNNKVYFIQDQEIKIRDVTYFSLTYNILTNSHKIQKIRDKIKAVYPNFSDKNEESTMKEDNICFFLNNNPELCECLQKRLFQMGYGWCTKQTVQNTNVKYLFINLDKTLQHSTRMSETDKIKYKLIDLSFLAPPQIQIDDYKVEFQAGSIKVGCTTVSNDIVREIFKNLRD